MLGSSPDCERQSSRHRHSRTPEVIGLFAAEGGVMANKQTDSGRAYNALLERANNMQAQIVRLETRIKVLEERASREDIASELASVGKRLGRMYQDG